VRRWKVPRGTTKYRSKAEVVDGLRFSSRLEARRYRELVAMHHAGMVEYFIRQPSFDLGGGVRYVADFLVVWSPALQGAPSYNRVTVEDCKGIETEVFKVKKRLFAAAYPKAKLVILTKKDVR
jgi:hypothetical protein